MAKLYVVGTPIGNLSDFSPRAAEILKTVDFIAAEDTRVTLKLLNHLGIHKPLVSYHEHSQRERSRQIAERILAGETCAVVSDAGMPCISDPGEELVRLCGSLGIETVVIPGPSAAVSALAVSGLSTSRFTFEGFLSTNKNSRGEHLASLAEERRTMIFYEAPHKLTATLRDLRDAFGGSRAVSLCRELTKIHEEIFRTTLEEACARYEGTTPKGEFVLVVAGKPEESSPQMTLEEAVCLAERHVEEGMKPTEAARMAAKSSGFSKPEIYQGLMKKE